MSVAVKPVKSVAESTVGLSVCSDGLSSPVSSQVPQSCGKSFVPARRRSVSSPVSCCSSALDCRLAGVSLSPAASSSSVPVSLPEPSAFALSCRSFCPPVSSQSSVSSQPVSSSVAPRVFTSPCCSSCKPVVCSANSGFVFKSSSVLSAVSSPRVLPSALPVSSSCVSPVFSSPRVLPSLVRSSSSLPVSSPRVLPLPVSSPRVLPSSFPSPRVLPLPVSSPYSPRFFPVRVMLRWSLLPLFVPGFGFIFAFLPLLFCGFGRL